MDVAIPTGSRFISLGGRIWTVRHVTAERFVMISASPHGDRGIVVDLAALLQMVRIEDSEREVGGAELARPEHGRRAHPVPSSASGGLDD